MSSWLGVHPPEESAPQGRVHICAALVHLDAACCLTCNDCLTACRTPLALVVPPGLFDADHTRRQPPYHAVPDASPERR